MFQLGKTYFAFISDGEIIGKCSGTSTPDQVERLRTSWQVAADYSAKLFGRPSASVIEVKRVQLVEV